MKEEVIRGIIYCWNLRRKNRQWTVKTENILIKTLNESRATYVKPFSPQKRVISSSLSSFDALCSSLANTNGQWSNKKIIFRDASLSSFQLPNSVFSSLWLSVLLLFILHFLSKVDSFKKQSFQISLWSTTAISFCLQAFKSRISSLKLWN